MANSGGASFLWSIMWLLVLFFFGIWLSGFCAFWYIVFSIFVPCCQGCKGIVDLLLKGVQFAGICSSWMVGGVSPTEAFK